MTDNQLVPLVTLALELNTSVDTLARRFEGSIVFDDAGLRCITAERSRVYLASVRAEAEQVHRRRLALAAERAAAPNPLRERVRAIQRRQEALGTPVDGDGAALARMMEASGARDEQLTRAAAERRELMTGQTTYHRIQEGN